MTGGGVLTIAELNRVVQQVEEMKAAPVVIRVAAVDMRSDIVAALARELEAEIKPFEYMKPRACLITGPFGLCYIDLETGKGWVDQADFSKPWK